EYAKIPRSFGQKHNALGKLDVNNTGSNRFSVNTASGSFGSKNRMSDIVVSTN
ncbi:hypothetical protein EVA_19439, partial [gut metagenome]